MANLLKQSFYYKIPGPIVFFAIACTIMWLTVKLMNDVYKSKVNYIWAMAPFTLTIVLANNYNLPFSIFVSVVFVLLLLLLLAKKGKSLLSFLIIYIPGAIIIYYFSGSGYMLLFSVLALFYSTKFK